MPDYKNYPRQRGISDVPLHETNPRRFARTRCENTLNLLDRTIVYMGEIIQTYSPENMTPTEALNHALELKEILFKEKIDLNSIFDYLNSTETAEHGLGKFGGYILMAAMVMQACESLRDTVVDLRSRI